MADRGLTFLPAEAVHVDWLAPRLRAADVREIEVLSGGTPYAALYTSYRLSTGAWTARQDGEIGAMFGYRADPLGRAAVIWALGTEALTERPIRLIRGVKRYVDDWGSRHKMLTNLIHDENEASMKLLRYLGFTFAPAKPGVLRFWKER